MRMLTSTALSFRLAFTLYASPCFFDGGVGGGCLEAIGGWGLAAVLGDYPRDLPGPNTFYVVIASRKVSKDQGS
jgi:hypothetical protein